MSYWIFFHRFWKIPSIIYANKKAFRKILQWHNSASCKHYAQLNSEKSYWKFRFENEFMVNDVVFYTQRHYHSTTRYRVRTPRMASNTYRFRMLLPIVLSISALSVNVFSVPKRRNFWNVLSIFVTLACFGPGPHPI